MPGDESADSLAAFLGQEVVIDLASSYVCLGILAGQDHRYLVLKNADLHDLRDTTTTREVYVLDCRRHGISWNRRKVLVKREDVVSVSLLSDVRD